MVLTVLKELSHKLLKYTHASHTRNGIGFWSQVMQACVWHAARLRVASPAVGAKTQCGHGHRLVGIGVLPWCFGHFPRGGEATDACHQGLGRALSGLLKGRPALKIVK